MKKDQIDFTLMLRELMKEMTSSELAKELINIDYTYADRVAINLDFELQDRETFLNKLIGVDDGSSKTAH